MKKIPAKILIIALSLTIVYVGGFAMRHTDNPYHQECATFAGIECAFGANAVASISAHLDVLKSISTGILPISVVLAVFLILAIIFAWKNFKEINSFSKFQQLNFVLEQTKTRAFKKRLDWLAVLEKRDPALN